jgi:hypothetical protein
MNFVRSIMFPFVLLSVPPLFDPPKPLIENERVRATLITSAPHSKSQYHTRSSNGVLVFLNQCTGTFLREARRTDNLNFEAGEVHWSRAGESYTVESIGDRQCRVLEVEPRSQGRPVPLSPLDPVKLLPGSYKVLMDNPQVRVLRVNIGARQKVPLHEHSFDRVIVNITDLRVRITEENGKATESVGAAGEIRFAGLGRHREENLADIPLEVVVVELK